MILAGNISNDSNYLNEAFSRQIIPPELWQKIKTGNQIFSVIFVKRTDGLLRPMNNATFNVNKMLERNPNSGGKSHKMDEYDLFFVRDGEQPDRNGVYGAPRSIPLENIIQIKCGKIYDFKKVNNIAKRFPQYKDATLAKSKDDNIIMVENKIKQMKSKDIKLIVENIFNGILKEQAVKIKTEFIQEYSNKFRELQDRYNKFWDDGSLSYVLFYSLMQDTEKYTDMYDSKWRSVVGEIDTVKDRYYDDMEYYQEIERAATSLSDKISSFSQQVEQAARALKEIDDVEYTINLF